MSTIEYEDISALIHALAAGNSHIEITKEDHKNLGEWCIEQKSYIKKGFDVVTKLRKELRLPDDPIYNNPNSNLITFGNHKIKVAPHISSVFSLVPAIQFYIERDKFDDAEILIISFKFFNLETIIALRLKVKNRAE